MKTGPGFGAAVAGKGRVRLSASRRIILYRVFAGYATGGITFRTAVDALAAKYAAAGDSVGVAAMNAIRRSVDAGRRPSLAIEDAIEGIGPEEGAALAMDGSGAFDQGLALAAEICALVGDDATDTPPPPGEYALILSPLAAATDKRRVERRAKAGRRAGDGGGPTGEGSGRDLG